MVIMRSPSLSPSREIRIKGPNQSESKGDQHQPHIHRLGKPQTQKEVNSDHRSVVKSRLSIHARPGPSAVRRK